MPKPEQKISLMIWGALAALMIGIGGMVTSASLYLFFVFVFILALFAVACLAFVGYLIDFPSSGGE